MTFILEEDPLVFEINANMIEDRRDVMYYHPKFIKTLDKLKKYPWDLKELRNIATIFDGPFGSELRSSDYVSEGIPFLRVQNIKENEIDTNNVVYITKKDHNRIKRSELKPRDIVITKTGSLGIASVIPPSMKKCNIRADLAGIVIKKELKGKINPYFLAIFLNSKLGRLQSERFNSGSTRPRILVRYIKKILVPIPPIEIQNKMVELINDSIMRAKKLRKKADKIEADVKIEIEKILEGGA